MQPIADANLILVMQNENIADRSNRTVLLRAATLMPISASADSSIASVFLPLRPGVRLDLFERQPGNVGDCGFVRIHADALFGNGNGFFIHAAFHADDDSAFHASSMRFSSYFCKILHIFMLRSCPGKRHDLFERQPGNVGNFGVVHIHADALFGNGNGFKQRKITPDSGSPDIMCNHFMIKQKNSQHWYAFC